MPLVFQTRDWTAGTFVGSIVRSFATSASDQVGLTNDPMAMKPFIGYNVKVRAYSCCHDSPTQDYWQHWLDVGKVGGDKMPKVFHVNWFQKDDAGLCSSHCASC
jgi:phosphoenolpyruvate carboxykinase (GTP)